MTAAFASAASASTHRPTVMGRDGMSTTRAPDENLSLRLSQLTRIPVTTVGEGEPVRLVLQLTETDLFQCPFVMMTEPGGADLSAEGGEAAADATCARAASCGPTTSGAAARGSGGRCRSRRRCRRANFRSSRCRSIIRCSTRCSTSSADPADPEHRAVGVVAHHVGARRRQRRRRTPARSSTRRAA